MVPSIKSHYGAATAFLLLRQRRPVLRATLASQGGRSQHSESGRFIAQTAHSSASSWHRLACPRQSSAS